MQIIVFRDSARRARSRRLAACAIVVLVTLVARDGGSAYAQRLVQYHPAQIVKPAPVLTGDPTDGRCADSKAPCFKDNTDFTNGQRRMLRIEDVGIAMRTRDTDAEGNDAGNSFFLGGKMTTVSGGVSSVKASALQGSLATAAPVVALGARLFNGATDALVSAVATENALSVVAEGNGGTVPSPPTLGYGLQDPGAAVPELFAATGDFDGDGLDEIVFAMGGKQPKLSVMYSSDPNNPNAGIAWGTQITVNRMVATATGNFLGTGVMVVIAALQSDGTLLLQYFDVDPSTRALALRQSLPLSRPAGAITAVHASIAVGRFNPAAFVPSAHDQLVIAVSDFLRTDLLTVDAAAASGSSTLTPVQRLQGTTDGQSFMRPVVRAGRLNWSSTFDAVVLLLTNSSNKGTPPQNRVFTLLTLDENLDVATQSPDYQLGPSQCIYDLQVGNFDRRKNDNTPNAHPGATLHDFNLQIALLTSTAVNTRPSGSLADDFCSGGDAGDTSKGLIVQFYGVNVSDGGALSAVGPAGYTWSSSTQAKVREASLAIPDLDGRSMVLGAPTLLIVDQAVQLVASIAAPPMHADVIDAKLTNLSVAPDGFSAQFDWTSAADNKITGHDTSSYANGYAENLSGSFSSGVGCAPDAPVGGCATVDVKTSFSQQVTNSTTTMSGSFSSWNLEVQDATALDDLVAYSDSAVTFYIYPVLGKTACPGSAPGCPSSEQKQAVVVFSGPDSVQRAILDASLIPWYQPPWMPGNVLSYPGTLDQLQAAAYPGNMASYQPLSNGNQTWATDATTGTQKNTWSSTSTAGSTVSSSHNYQYHAGVSVTGRWNWGVASGSVSTGFDYTRTNSVENVIDSTTNLSQSSGVVFTKQAQFANPGTYAYLVTPSIFGQLTPPAASGAFTDEADLTAFGALRVGYVVDLLGASSGGGTGSFWSSATAYRSAPDIAFNQPGRFTVITAVSDRGDGTCLLANRSLTNWNCVSLNAPKPAEPFNDEYHHMRGFFITGDTPGGPQLATAHAGDQLRLQARVHNFSFKPMPIDSTVNVRFYAMPWDIGNARQAGPSVVIGTVASNQRVPPYSNASDAPPNWILVSQAFDTTSFSGQDLVFWAVTWMEDGKGNLLGELPAKGLTGIPGSTMDFAAVAASEELYGNNVGLFHQVFHVIDPQVATTARKKVLATEPTVVITDVGADATSTRLGQTVLLGARIRAAAAHPPKSGLTVHFVEGDPAQGGTVVGVKHLPRLKGGSTHEYHANYRPHECGRRSLYVVAGPGKRFEHVAKLGEIAVTCPPGRSPPIDEPRTRCPTAICRQR